MATAGAKVTVACKVPVAWLDLQLYEPRTEMENTQTGPRERKVFRATGNIVRIRGTSYPRGTPPLGFPDKPQIVNGFALTQGVEKDFWDKWLVQNAKSPMVISGALAAFESLDALKGKTRDRSADMTGLEPVSPYEDNRMPKPSLRGVGPVTTEEERAKTLVEAA